VLPRSNSSGTLQDGGRRHLELMKSGMLSNDNPCMANIYLHTKFDENVFTDDRDMANDPNTRWRSPPFRIFPKVGYFSMRTLVWPLYVRTLKLIQIYSSVTEIWPKIQIQHGGRRCREFCQKWDDQGMANNPDSRWRPPPLNFNIYQKWDIGPQ